MANLTFLFYLYFFCLSFSAYPLIEAVQVTTQNGIVEGTQFLTAEQQKTVYAFFGIPYAKPPVGKLRFESPQPPSNWTGVRNATYERDVCVQNFNLPAVIGSENCLFVNVFTTKLPTSSNNSLLPVMVWIHGGAFVYGSGNMEGQGPDYLLNDGVLVVTLNYRLGLFGFLSTGDLVCPGNNGLRDIVMALKWVRANIGGFGGNAKSITLFGQSAGGASIAYLLQSKKTAGLYNKAIMQSGTSFCIWGLSRRARSFAFEVGRRLSIFTNNSQELVNHFKNLNFTTLQNASQTSVDQTSLYIHLNGFDITPVKEVEHQGALFTSRSYELVKTGKFNQVPLLVGFNSEEGSTFVPAFLVLKAYFLLYDVTPSALVPADMNIVNETEANFVGELIHSHYVGVSGSMYLNYTGFIRFFSDSFFTRPIPRYVEFLSKFVRTYFYEFTYLGDLGNPDRTEPLGVGHGEDLNYIFRVASSDNASSSDKLTRKRIVRMWTNFAKAGNPTPISDPILQNIMWPVASTNKNLTFLNIGSNLAVDTNPHRDDVDFWNELYDNHGNPPYDTY